MIRCRAWLGKCDTNVGGLTPGVPLDTSNTVTFFKALTRVLWRELLTANKVRIVVEWDQEPGLANIEIQTPDGELLIANTVLPDWQTHFTSDMWPEITFLTAEPSVDWLCYLVDGWLTSDDSELLDAGASFPGVDPDTWDDLTDDEALEVARASVESLSQSIAIRDLGALTDWAHAAPINGGWYTEVAAAQWSDTMTWSKLPIREKEEIRQLLRHLNTIVDDSGCDGLLLLTEIADV